MKKVLISSIILLFLSIILCEKSKGQFDFSKPIVISDKILPSINASTLFEGFEYIQLDNNPLIGRIGKIVLYKERVYLLDLTMNSIVCFNRKGQFVSQFLKVGRGPFEYREINDFNVLEKSDKIIVLTNNNTLYELDLNLIDQKLLFQTQFNTTNFAIINERNFLFYTPFGIYNETKKEWIFHELINYSIREKQFTALIANSNPVKFGYSTVHTIFNSKAILMAPLMQYSLFVNSDSISNSILHIEFGSLGHSREKFSKIKSYNDWVELTDPDANGNGKVRFITSPFLVKNILFFKSIINGVPISTFYNLSYGESIITRSIVNDLKASIPFGKIEAVTNNAFITIIEPLELIRFQENLPEKKKLSLNIKESDNPIICFYYVKN